MKAPFTLMRSNQKWPVEVSPFTPYRQGIESLDVAKGLASIRHRECWDRVAIVDAEGSICHIEGFLEATPIPCRFG